MKRVRIGNGCGFWGDNLDAPLILVERGQLDYLTLEYLAELTMSILALQKQRDPEAGFATDFLDVLERLCPYLKTQPNLKIITNAGGMNPQACASRARTILNKAGLSDRIIATVEGDNLFPRLEELKAHGHQFKHLDTGEPLDKVRDRVVSANAYLGSQPIVQALEKGASLVIAGRVADASLTVAPAVHEFGYSWHDWDHLAGATIAGHLIECGAQVTGGLWTNWRESPRLDDVGYPIAEIERNGDFTITKTPDTGGAVNRETVLEQLFYEIGDPSAYLTPDVIADFSPLKISEAGSDRVEVRGARGKPATNFLKVSLAYRDGFTASGTLVLVGRDAVVKARSCGEMIFQRLLRAGFNYQDRHVECLGAGDVVPGMTRSDRDPWEVVLRVGVHDPRRNAVERFVKEFAPLVTSGPPGVTGYTTGRPSVREVFAYWPALIAKDALVPDVHLF